MVVYMTETEQYVNIMIDSLSKKDEILEKIIEQNNIQSQIASKENFDLESFGKSVEDKQELIDQLTALDNGFQSLFDKVKEELNGKKTRYTAEIRKMQELIKMLTEKGIKIKAQEEKNRLSITAHFEKMKKEVKVAKKSMRVASDYYKNMSKTSYVDSQFMDSKK